MTVEELADTLDAPSERLIRVFAEPGEWKEPDSVLSTQKIELVYEEMGYRGRVPPSGS